jgi:hypothetical protein
MNLMHDKNREIFWSCFPAAPDQPPIGKSPQTYLAWLNQICGLSLVWPKNHHTGALNRSQIIGLCHDSDVNVLVAYAAVMAWGGRNYHNYQLSLEDKNHLRLIPILETLRSSTQSRQEDFTAMQQAAESIKGLGISFYTKLLFFMRPTSDAYILDQFTAKSAGLLFDDCRVALNYSGYPDPKTPPISYEWFCDAIEKLGRSRASHPSWTGEQTEQAMFDVRGGKWRRYILKMYGEPVAETSLERISSIPSTPPTISDLPQTKLSPELEAKSLALLIAQIHGKAYHNGEELPGSSPKPTNSPPIRVHCRLVDGVIWQYALQKHSVHAQVFIPPKQIGRYDELRSHLEISDHDFGHGIHGSGDKGGKTRSLRKTVDGGLDADPSQWDKIAQNAVEAMAVLFQRLNELL